MRALFVMLAVIVFAEASGRALGQNPGSGNFGPPNCVKELLPGEKWEDPVTGKKVEHVSSKANRRLRIDIWKKHERVLKIKVYVTPLIVARISDLDENDPSDARDDDEVEVTEGGDGELVDCTGIRIRASGMGARANCTRCVACRISAKEHGTVIGPGGGNDYNRLSATAQGVIRDFEGTGNSWE